MREPSNGVQQPFNLVSFPRILLAHVSFEYSASSAFSCILYATMSASSGLGMPHIDLPWSKLLSARPRRIRHAACIMWILSSVDGGVTCKSTGTDGLERLRYRTHKRLYRYSLKPWPTDEQKRCESPRPNPWWTLLSRR